MRDDRPYLRLHRRAPADDSGSGRAGWPARSAARAAVACGHGRQVPMQCRRTVPVIGCHAAGRHREAGHGKSPARGLRRRRPVDPAGWRASRADWGASHRQCYIHGCSYDGPKRLRANEEYCRPQSLAQCSFDVACCGPELTAAPRFTTQSATFEARTGSDCPEQVHAMPALDLPMPSVR